MALYCFEKTCSECGKKLGLFGGYHHPTEGKKKCICGECWKKLDESERKYGSFISNATFNKDIGCICFVLISASPKYEHLVYNKLSKIPEILELHPLLGWYDIIVKIGMDDSTRLGNFIVKKIRKIEGIKDTRTLTGTFSLEGMRK
jgi:DNA-binding Lrp family transcriptional regulator